MKSSSSSSQWHKKTSKGSFTIDTNLLSWETRWSRRSIQPRATWSSWSSRWAWSPWETYTWQEDQGAEKTPESIRTSPPAMPKAHEKRFCASPSTEGVPIQLRELLSIQSLPQRVSGTLRGGAPYAVSFYKNHKQFTLETLTSWGSIWRSFIDSSSFPKVLPKVKLYWKSFTEKLYWKR